MGARRRRRGGRGSDGVALAVMAGAAGLVVVPRVAHLAAQQAASLTVLGACVLAVAAVAVQLEAALRNVVPPALWEWAQDGGSAESARGAE